MCAGCRDCGGNPPKPEEEPDEEPIDELECEEIFRDIEDIVLWQNAGIATDWSLYDYETKRLVLVWRSAEREVALQQQSRMATFIKSWFKEQ